MIETELGSLRRSHYSNEIDSSMNCTQVTVMGWVLTIRGHGNISFGTIRDKNGDLSIVAKKGDCPDDIREKISSLKAHSSIAITGNVKSSEKAPSGFEIIPTELRVFSLLQERDELPKNTTMYDFVLKVIPENIKSELSVELIDEIFQYVTSAHNR